MRIRLRFVERHVGRRGNVLSHLLGLAVEDGDAPAAFPEPISLDWRTWVDNSTTPVNVWYGEHNGYLVHIQPLD